MPSEILNKARAYEAEHGAAISPAERPVYHMTPYVGCLLYTSPSPRDA